MDGLCGVFRPDLIPDWIAKVGPGVAALIAVVLYGLNRWHVRQDLAGKREVLRAMITERLWEACRQVSQRRKLFEDYRKEGRTRWRSVVEDAKLMKIDRLMELQPELLKIGIRGDGVLAAFIESCRTYEHTVTALEANLARTDDGDNWIGFDFRNRLDDAKHVLDDLNDKAEKARRALGRA